MKAAKNPQNSHESSELMSFLEGFRNHRIGQHGEDRAGGNSGCCGNNFRSEAAEKCIADQCGSAGDYCNAGSIHQKT
jgi:hypothetical protein